MKRVLVLVVLAIMLPVISCKKEKAETISVQGRIFDPNTGSNVEGARVVLSGSKLETGGIYSSYYSEIATAITDAGGNFGFQFTEDRYAGYRISVSKDLYFGYTEDVTTSEIKPGIVFSPVYNIYPVCYVRLRVRNSLPFDEDDHFAYSFTAGYLNTSGGCSNTIFQGSGMTYSDTIRCSTYGNQIVKLGWHVTKNGISLFYEQSKYCPAFDTTFFNIDY